MRDNQGEVTVSPDLIIKRLDNQGMKSLTITENQAFHHVSPNFSNSADDSPEQTVNRRKIEYYLPLLSTTHRSDYH